MTSTDLKRVTSQGAKASRRKAISKTNMGTRKEKDKSHSVGDTKEHKSKETQCAVGDVSLTEKHKQKQKKRSLSPGNLKKNKATNDTITDSSPGLMKKRSNKAGSQPKKKKRKVFNKEAIENMKAKQLAKKRTQLIAAEASEQPKRRPKLPLRLETVDLKFGEDDRMTEYEGCWVSRDEVWRLAAARETMQQRGVAPEKLQKRMKLMVRAAHRRLKRRLIAGLVKTERQEQERRMFLASSSERQQRQRRPGRYSGLLLREDDSRLGKFDGFWVSAEAVLRLQALREKLQAEGHAEDHVRRLVNKERRAEECKLKSTGKLVCAKCGGRGHLASDCEAEASSGAAGGACFRCGEAGHRLSDCPAAVGAGLPFATCFLCQRRGHMSRDCPQRQDPPTPAAGQATESLSWRGLTHDVGDTPPPATSGRASPVAPKVTEHRAEATTSRKHKRFTF